MSVLIGLLMLLAQVLGWDITLFEDNSGIIDVVPPTETRWCGISWGDEDDPYNSLSFGCFEFAAPIDETIQTA